MNREKTAWRLMGNSGTDILTCSIPNRKGRYLCLEKGNVLTPIARFAHCEDEKLFWEALQNTIHVEVQK